MKSNYFLLSLSLIFMTSAYCAQAPITIPEIVKRLNGIAGQLPNGPLKTAVINARIIAERTSSNSQVLEKLKETKRILGDYGRNEIQNLINDIEKNTAQLPVYGPQTAQQAAAAARAEAQHSQRGLVQRAEQRRRAQSQVPPIPPSREPVRSPVPPKRNLQVPPAPFSREPVTPPAPPQRALPAMQNPE